MPAEGNLADYACVACRKLKRKCNKALPSCSLCSRVGRPCDYQDPSKGLPNGGYLPLRKARGGQSFTLASTRALNRTPKDPSVIGSNVSALPFFTGAHERPGRWYLDSVATRGSEMVVPRELLWSDVVIEPLPPTRAEAEDIIRHFYANTHEWWPVISCRRITREMEAITDITTADLVALLFAMQLISNSGSEASQEAYHATKAALAACEQVNQMTSNYCGAYILIATFELGNAMYPTAYFTISHCTRIFYALGSHDKKKATQIFGTCDTWVETEERRRLWWAAITLDRYAHILFRFRPLSVQHIPGDEIIPANDDAWDGGELTVNALLVMSIEATTAVAPFARTCQAAHILGKACHHVNDVPTADDADLHLEEAVQIARATHALKTLIEQDSAVSENPSRLFTARALCLSTQQLLFDVHSCIESGHVDSGGGNKGLRLELQQLAIDGSKTAATECVGFAEELEAHIMTHGPASISPFVLNALYSAAGTWAWYYRETGNQGHLDKLNGLRRTIDTLQNQWHAGIDFLMLLENTEYTYSGACYQ